MVGPQDEPGDNMNEQTNFPAKVAQAAQEMADTNNRVASKIRTEIDNLTNKIDSFKTMMKEMKGFKQSNQVFAAEGDNLIQMY